MINALSTHLMTHFHVHHYFYLPNIWDPFHTPWTRMKRTRSDVLNLVFSFTKRAFGQVSWPSNEVGPRLGSRWVMGGAGTPPGAQPPRHGPQSGWLCCFSYANFATRICGFVSGLLCEVRVLIVFRFFCDLWIWFLISMLNGLLKSSHLRWLFDFEFCYEICLNKIHVFNFLISENSCSAMVNKI